MNLTMRDPLLFVIAAALALPVVAQPAEPDPPTPPAEKAAADEPSQDPLPSLDDLLGIESEEKPAEEDLSQDAALERALSDEQVSDAFRQAVTEMRDVAELLEGRQPGARAQRMQEEIILKLDMLIEQARRNQQQSSSSSSSSQSQQNPTRNQQRAQQQQSAQAGQGENRGEATPPPRRDGELGELIQGSSAAWGQLPERVREALLQGTSDRFSSLYESLTEAYFRRLAEESTKP